MILGADTEIDRATIAIVCEKVTTHSITELGDFSSAYLCLFTCIAPHVMWVWDQAHSDATDASFTLDASRAASLGWKDSDLWDSKYMWM